MNAEGLRKEDYGKPCEDREHGSVRARAVFEVQVAPGQPRRLLCLQHYEELLHFSPSRFSNIGSMDDQHKLIKGYRDLSQEEIDHMNAVKLAAEGVGRLCAAMDTLAGIDKRWLAIAKTDLQKGFMFLVRSIAKPETF